MLQTQRQIFLEHAVDGLSVLVFKECARATSHPTAH